MHSRDKATKEGYRTPADESDFTVTGVKKGESRVWRRRQAHHPAGARARCAGGAGASGSPGIATRVTLAAICAGLPSAVRRPLPAALDLPLLPKRPTRRRDFDSTHIHYTILFYTIK
ncbi:unnamed protein product, partial [Brenthis ino]